MEIKKTAHSTYALKYYLVWCTKFRNKVLTGKVEVDLKTIISETCAAYEWDLDEIGIMPDHVHLVISVPPTESLTDVSRTLKSISANYLFSQNKKLKGQKFWGSGLWSKSTYYGTVGNMTKDTVRNYVSTQKERG